MHMQNLNKTYTSEGTKDLERHYIFQQEKNMGLLVHVVYYIHQV